MNEWALLKGGKIWTVVTTNSGKKHMEEHYPDSEVKAFYSLPAHVKKGYRYYEERP